MPSLSKTALREEIVKSVLATATPYRHSSGSGYWTADRSTNLFRGDQINILERAGYQFVRGMTADQLYGIMERMDRQLPCYYNCSDAELDESIENRGLQYVRSTKSSNINERGRNGKIEALMIADDAPKFEKFLDLPPELRNAIHDLSMSHLPEVLIVPTQPPLSRTCRAIRAEVLPLFYARFTFHLTYTRTLPGNKKDAAPPYRAEKDTTIFLLTLDDERVRHVKGLKYVFYERQKRYIATPITCEVHIGTSNEMGYEVTVDGRHDNQSARVEAKRRVEKYLEMVFEREAGRRLRMRDVRGIQEALAGGDE